MCSCIQDIPLAFWKSNRYVVERLSFSPLGIQYEARAYLSNTSTTQDSSAKVGAVYKRLGVDLSDSSLMTQSITHKSFSHGSVPTNERLGYLGKAG